MSLLEIYQICKTKKLIKLILKIKKTSKIKAEQSFIKMFKGFRCESGIPLFKPKQAGGGWGEDHLTSLL